MRLRSLLLGLLFLAFLWSAAGCGGGTVGTGPAATKAGRMPPVPGK